MVGTKQRFCMDTIVLLVLFLMTFYCVSDAQEINNCDETSNCSEVIRCIRQYKTLQTHILNNEEIMDEITTIFFRTGHAASKFVKITYNFQVSKSSKSSNTDATDDYDGLNCFSHQNTYIWSESALYLLGPKPLYWFTIFTINVPEVNVSIELPCLCHYVYDSLLSQLTSKV